MIKIVTFVCISFYWLIKTVYMAHSIKGRLVYVLLTEGVVVGTWVTLTTLCEEMNTNEPFASYSKLSKDIAKSRREGNLTPAISFTTKEGKSYTLKVESLK